jgi:hypothetical protein
MNKTLYNVGLGLAIALMLCLFPMPYGYYTLVRFASMIIFGCMAYIFYKEDRVSLCIVAGSLALLFQPFFKIVLGKAMWNIVDVMVALALVLLWYKNRKN